MALSPDFSDSIPVDHTKLNTNNAALRAIRALLGDRLSAIVSGFVSGETVKGILNLPFIASSAPSTVTDQIQLYGKVVSTKTELHAKDEDGNEFQITTGGKLNAGVLGGTLSATIMGQIYPIGSVVTLGVSTNPNTLFGVGTWAAIAGKVIVGISGSDTEFDTLDETGGEKTHAMTSDENGPHTHTVPVPPTPGAGGSGASYSGTPSNVTTSSSGLGTPHNNLQPYIVKYVWQRTA